MQPPVPNDVQKLFKELYQAACSSADFTEGDRAFLERRKAEFSMPAKARADGGRGSSTDA